MKLLFTPIGIISGLLAGWIARKGFDRIWSLIDDGEPPQPDQREASYPKLVAALLMEGALLRMTKGIVDHGVRGGFARMTGTWPGEKAPDQA
jgi:hypothetical protein